MTLGFRAASDQGQQLAWIGGSVHRVLLDSQATDGRLTALRSIMRRGAGSPVHVHERDDETVFLLSGTATFWAGRDRWELTSGDTAFLPRGLPHTYLFTSETADMLTVCNPAGMEDFFRAAGWDLANPQPEAWSIDLDRLATAAAATGQQLLGPPLGPTEDMPEHYL
jgi:quercetin dioxygenase-like cupin family protein